MMELSGLRVEYSKGGLDEADLHQDPIQQFREWLREALAKKLHEPYAMTLATATTTGVPSARIVLLREVSEAGFTFFTNYDSRKCQETSANPQASLLFFWADLERQVRIEGTIALADEETSNQYFVQRPRESQIAAVASAQSSVISSRAVLEQRVEELNRQLEGKPVPRPANWGGLVLKPIAIEFWQGRPSRLHDRLRYRLDKKKWILERLSP